MTSTIPDGYTTVTPWIISADTPQLIAFLAAAFGGVEIARLANADGSIAHAEIRIGDAVVMAFDAPEGIAPVPAFIRLYVPDARIGFAKAIQAGATEVTKPTLLAFGDRVARIRDPLGNIWWLQQRVEDVSEEEMQQRWGDPRWSEPMAYVQKSLVEALRR
ncbi:MAG: Glyoxalase/bleomycin resistance protein/dioxygenase [Devosia sp.]|uniref:VOC family protein n=1 Tax=Devosia sp. TaxID=1871048 RepID=UPI0026341282|nr:VOC family protein [Devosia sp.]MDB5541033.1 Glyoxalase/bleomycin resistance protein/dioxygenase [Devosia sp.]